MTDVQQYGFNGSSGNTSETHNKTTTFRGQTIDWPPLNISAYDLPNPFYWGWKDKQEGYYDNGPFRGGPETLYLVDSDLYSSSQLEQNGVCQPTIGEVRGSYKDPDVGSSHLAGLRATVSMGFLVFTVIYRGYSSPTMVPSFNDPMEADARNTEA